jgi:hypothetical protein
MSNVNSFVRSLFSVPGSPIESGCSLHCRAAAAHDGLLSFAANCPELSSSLGPIAAFLDGPSSPMMKSRLLCDPLFIQGLHAISPFCRELRTWHARVTSCPTPPATEPAAIASLGNVALSILLEGDRRWCGRCNLCTDILGRLGFPSCDWTLRLSSALGAPLSTTAVSVTLDHDRACWRISDETDHPFLVMPRDECVRMLVDNDPEIAGERLRLPDPAVRLWLSCAPRMGRAALRYDPIAFPSGTDHAAVAGGLIAQVLEAMRQDAPAIHQEFCTYVRAVRGFEFPRSAAVASFSDPTLPGVMNLSVAFTDQDEPCLDPFCFTWFGHEMGHTKDYLCDTILYSQGESLATNWNAWSNPIARYGRPLAVRTLLQIPYTHLYEWELLMDFFEADFRGLPWRIDAGADAVGVDFQAEIEESFALIDEWADLTPIGMAALDHFHEMFNESAKRWNLLRTNA